MLPTKFFESEDTQPYILATCQQSRFFLTETLSSPEVAIDGLNIAIISPKPSSKSAKGKGKASRSLEILTNAELKLKGGVHYGLLGRNGTGKSTFLRAIADKLIPGLPYTTKVSILQQTATELVTQGPLATAQASGSDHVDVPPKDTSGKAVLQQVMESNISKNEVLREIDMLSTDVDDGDEPWPQVRAYRQLRHQRLHRQLLEIQKMASLRSGARGYQVRKDLIAFEKKVAESKELINQKPDEINSPSVQEEIQAASELLVALQTKAESVSHPDFQSNARSVLQGLGFKESDLQKSFEDLSGGWRMRAMLAIVLIQDADIMILDEPTNFLDLLGIIWLQNYLVDLRSSNGKTVLIVSHDREFIDNVCEEIILLKDQSLTYFRGNLTAYEEDLKARQISLTRMKEANDRQVAHMEKTISSNIKAGKKTGDDNKLRQAVSRQKRINDRTGMQVNANGGRFKLSRDRAGFHDSMRDEIEIPPQEKSMTLVLPMAAELRFPGPLVSLDNVFFKYPSHDAFILKDLSLTIHMGDRVGIVGVNGCGKSTLIKLITDANKSSKGIITRHPRLRLGYYSQYSVEDLQSGGLVNPSTTALSMLAEDAGLEMEEGDMRALLGSLGLPGQIASDVPVAKLSGGQLVRLALARILWRHPHLLVLDEVTTHLDFYTVSALIEALSAFDGALLVVSHDRFLIRSVVENGTSQGAGDDDDAGESKTMLQSRRNVYLLKNGKLVLQNEGVGAFERSLEKRAAKLYKP